MNNLSKLEYAAIQIMAMRCGQDYSAARKEFHAQVAVAAARALLDELARQEGKEA